MTNDLLAQRPHEGGAEASPSDFRNRPLHGEAEVLVDLDIELASRHLHRHWALYEPEPNRRTRSGTGGGSGRLRFACPALPDEDKEFLRAGRHSELHVRSLREQDMVF